MMRRYFKILVVMFITATTYSQTCKSLKFENVYLEDSDHYIRNVYIFSDSCSFLKNYYQLDDKEPLSPDVTREAVITERELDLGLAKKIVNKSYFKKLNRFVRRTIMKDSSKGHKIAIVELLSDDEKVLFKGDIRQNDIDKLMRYVAKLDRKMQMPYSIDNWNPIIEFFFYLTLPHDQIPREWYQKHLAK